MPCSLRFGGSIGSNIGGDGAADAGSGGCSDGDGDGGGGSGGGGMLSSLQSKEHFHCFA